MRDILRTALGKACVPFLNVTGYRFSKNFRHGKTLGHKIVYACIDTVGANCAAKDIS